MGTNAKMASVRKRTWQTTKGVEKTAWVVAYTHKGKQHLKTFPTKRAATTWRAEMQHEVKEGIHTPATTSVTVANAGALWLAQAETDGLEGSTVMQYRQHLGRHIIPFIGDVKLAELTPASVQEFRNQLIHEGRSHTMAKKVMTSLGAILATAMATGRVARNVVRDQARQHRTRQRRLEKRHTKRPEVGIGIPTKDEIRAMLAAAQGRWRPLVVTAVFTGLRASELRGLTWDDVDLDRATLRVRQRADRWNNIGSPKSESGQREVPLAPMVSNTLREWRLACPKGDANLVFPNTIGKVESLTVIHRRGLGPLQVEAKIGADNLHPKYGLHSLRHAAASLFIEQGFSPKRVQALMGHSTIQMTFDTYGHLFPSQDGDQAAMQQLQARLVG
jgi:integrase